MTKSITISLDEQEEKDLGAITKHLREQNPRVSWNTSQVVRAALSAFWRSLVKDKK